MLHVVTVLLVFLFNFGYCVLPVGRIRLFCGLFILKYSQGSQSSYRKSIVECQTWGVTHSGFELGLWTQGWTSLVPGGGNSTSDPTLWGVLPLELSHFLAERAGRVRRDREPSSQPLVQPDTHQLLWPLVICPLWQQYWHWICLFPFNSASLSPVVPKLWVRWGLCGLEKLSS